MMVHSMGISLFFQQADAIANYSHLFRRSEGMYLSFPNIDSMEEDFLEQIKGRDVDLIVCSDAEAILGIGDQGVGVKLDHTSIISSPADLRCILQGIGVRHAPHKICV
jgi:malic enzyme